MCCIFVSNTNKNAWKGHKTARKVWKCTKKEQLCTYWSRFELKYSKMVKYRLLIVSTFENRCTCLWSEQFNAYKNMFFTPNAFPHIKMLTSTCLSIWNICSAFPTLKSRVISTFQFLKTSYNLPNPMWPISIKPV